MHRPIVKFLEKRDMEGIVRRVSRFCLIGGILSLLVIIPLAARSWHVEENSFRIKSNKYFFHLEISPYFHETVEDLRLQWKEGMVSATEYVKLAIREIGLQPYSHKFRVYDGKGGWTQGENVYAYVRAPRAFGRECTLVAFKHNIGRYNISYHTGTPNIDDTKYPHFHEVALALSLIKQLNNQNYLSKDILFVGYDGDYQYGRGISTFLEDYHSGNNPQMARCGILRQGMGIDIQEDDYNQISIQLEGKNGKLPDMDIPGGVRQFVQSIHNIDKKLGVDWIWDDIGFFRNEPVFIKHIEYYHDLLVTTLRPYIDILFRSLGIEIRKPQEVHLSTILDFWKNQIFNRYEDPHFHMIEYGIQAFTLKLIKDPNKNPINYTTDNQIIGILELMMRYYQVLDEQLHAGSYQYFPVGKNYVVSLNIYYYPFALLLAAFVLPRFVHYQKYSRKKPHASTISYLLVSIIIGFAHLTLPSFLEWACSLLLGRLVLLREDLPEPVAISIDATNDTFYMLIIFFIGLLLIYHFIYEIIYPLLVFANRYFSKSPTTKDKRIITFYKQFKKDQYYYIDKEMLKDFLTFQLGIFSVATAVVNFPLALVNVVTLQFYLHISSDWKTNSWWKNIAIFGLPTVFFSGIGLSFYMKVSYVRLMRYLLIEYQTFGSPVYLFLMFCFCPFAHCVYRIIT